MADEVFDMEAFRKAKNAIKKGAYKPGEFLLVMSEREAADAGVSDGDVYDGATVVVHRMGGDDAKVS